MDLATVNNFLDTLYPEGTPGTVCVMQRRDSFLHAAWDRESFPFDGASYVCVSTVCAEALRIRRRKQDCVSACVVMLDDIGTKVLVPPPIAPTAILETSPGNFQYVYRIEPFHVDTESGAAYYEACLEALAGKGYTDKGALGVNRPYRVPGSINEKGEEQWACKLTEMHPERVWRLPDLMASFGVKDVKASTPPPPPKSDAPVNDDVLDWLQTNELIQHKNEDWYVLRCPWASEHTGGSSEAGYCPAGQGEHQYMRGFRCFHEHCSDRKANDFLAWVAEQGGPNADATELGDLHELGERLDDISIQERYKLVEAAVPSLQAHGLPDVKVSKEGFPRDIQLVTSNNVQWIVDECGISLRWNVHDKAMEISFENVDLQNIAPNEHTVKRCIHDLCQRLGIKGVKMIETILVERAIDFGYHPMAEWIRETPWDGVSRIGELADTVKVSQSSSKIWPIFLRRWLVQGVQAVFGWRNPQQMGQVLVFSGEQGAGKTLWFSSLVPKQFFAESGRLALGFAYKDSVITATKKAITELGELDSTFSKSDTGALKAFLSAARDIYRVPYAALTLEVPRTTIFCGTVNRIDFLMDETGARRYWPVQVIKSNAEHQVDMAQVWAEAYVLWERGTKWWLTPEEEVLHLRQVDVHQSTTAEEEIFNEYVNQTSRQPEDQYRAFNSTQLADRLGIQTSRQNLGSLRRMIEKKFGPRRSRVGARGENRGVQNGWMLPDPSFAGIPTGGDSNERVDSVTF